jgi:carboxyl-terminal processing protease
MYQSKSVSYVVVLFVVMVISFFFGFRSGALSIPPESLVASVANKEIGMPDDVDFSTFWKAWNILNEKYAGTTTTDQNKVWGAIEGMTASLGDPYTTFFPPEESKAFASEIAGNFEGVGMEIGMKDDRIVVVSPFKEAPAYKAGVRAGDYILSIDDVDTIGMATDQAVKLIRGKSGTQVKLSLARDGKPLEITITRAKIDLPTVKTETKDEIAGDADNINGLRKDGIFVISLYSFNANASSLFRNALKDFIDSGSHKLIIDLRGNPGGYLASAVDMASWFLPSGAVVVREEFGKDKEEHVYRSKGYDIFANSPLKMAILIDGGSASASEILAGALADHGVATLVGTKSFGKGSVQELISISDDTSLKVTIAKWLTPNGTSISGQGITPEYVVPVTEEDVKLKADKQMEKAVELLSKEQ